MIAKISKFSFSIQIILGLFFTKHVSKIKKKKTLFIMLTLYFIYPYFHLLYVTFLCVFTLVSYQLKIVIYM